MNFFEAQDRAKRASRWLVVTYLVATVLIVAGVTAIVGFALYAAGDPLTRDPGFVNRHAAILVATALLTALFIIGASLYKTALLAAGGGRVATQMGGVPVASDVSDPLRRRLRNVVEEMAIASGVPVPNIYVLEHESAINAFAAGYSPADAAVAVTRGALEVLDRDELQGVIAHEFSHILNGDMRLNIRLMGVLFGILVLGLIGRMIVRGGRHVNLASTRRSRGAPVVLMIGIGLAVLGGIGVLFARMIKAAVSRQREQLADASAVQFTRQTAGIAGALKKIGGYTDGSYLTAADPEEISHMLFGAGSQLSGLFATHPPLAERIRALDPSFRESDYPQVTARAAAVPGDEAGPDGSAAGFSSALAGGGAVASADDIADSVGSPEIEHVDYAARLRRALPAGLYDAAHSPELVYLLTIALVLDQGSSVLPRQLAVVEERLGGERTRIVRRLHEELTGAGAEIRLPLLEIAFPALRRRPAPQLEFLVELARRLIETDGRIDLYEYCYYRILLGNLAPAAGAIAKRRPPASRQSARAAAARLVALVAERGHDDPASRQAAYAAGAAELGDWADRGAAIDAGERSVARLDSSLDVLAALGGSSRRRVVRAVAAAAVHDQRLTVTEAELIRAVCATLDCPLPPLLVRLDPALGGTVRGG